MVFEHRQLRQVERRKIKIPSQQITTKQWLNIIDNFLLRVLERSLLGIRRNYDVEEITYFCTAPNSFAKDPRDKAIHYKASDDAAVIILPQRGSGFNYARLFATYLATNSISAYELQQPLRYTNLPDGMKSVTDIYFTPGTLIEIFNKGITEARGLVDIVEEQNIGVLGISMGAILSSILYGVEPKISSACLLLGGGALLDIIQSSADHFIQHVWSCLKNIPEEELRKSLQCIEPCRYTVPAKARNLLMINAMQDRTVPEIYGQILAKSWGNPRIHPVSGAGHLGMIRKLPELLPLILDHYDRALA